MPARRLDGQPQRGVWPRASVGARGVYGMAVRHGWHKRQAMARRDRMAERGAGCSIAALQ